MTQEADKPRYSHIDPRQRERLSKGISLVSYYNRRDYNSPDEEVAVNLTAAEIDLLGQAVVALHKRVGTASLVAGLLAGVEVGEEKVQAIEALHYRMAKAYHLAGGDRSVDPDTSWPWPDQGPEEPEAVNEEEVPAEVDPDPLIVDGPPSPLEVMAEEEIESRI